MLKAIADFFERAIADPAARGEETHSIELATAALLVEIAREAGEVPPEARIVVLRAVREKFGLDPAEAEALVTLAEEEARQATDYYQFTSLINQRFSAAQKVRVVELMWRAAYADDELSAHELHVMRKIADLLYVPHGDYIGAKLRARDAVAG